MIDLKPYLEDFVRTDTPDQSPPPLKTSASTWWTPLRWVLTGVAVLAIAVVGIVWLTGHGDGPLVVDAATSDRYPNATADDWVTYADHVLAVTPVAERAPAPADNDEDGGGGLIDRDVTLRVDRVLWSRPDPDRPAPATLDWKAWGWRYEADPGDRTAIVGAGSPRIELGHSYLLAVAWEPARCSPGDPVQPAGWTGLGSASTVPFDHGIVGEGEFEGRVRNAAEAKADADPSSPNFTFAQRMIGADGDQVAQALATARPGPPQQFVAPAPCR